MGFLECFRIPLALTGQFQRVKKPDVMAPRQLCNDLLHKLGVWPRFGKGPHVLQISNREPLHIREFMMQIRSKKINDFGTPAFILLAVQNVSTNAPIENDHLGINGESRASLG